MSGTDAYPTSITGLLSHVFNGIGSSSAPASSSTSQSQDPNLQLLLAVQRADRLASSLSTFSDNDTLDDLPTATLRALFIHSAWAEIEGRINTNGDFQQRRSRLQSSRLHYLTFVKTLFELDILPKNSGASSSSSNSSLNLNGSPLQIISSLLSPLVATLGGSGSSTTSSQATASLPSNPAQRRELKVALFKLERAFKSALDEYRSAARDKAASRSGHGLNVPATGTSTGAGVVIGRPEDAQWDLLILPKRKQRNGAADQDEEEPDEEEDAEEDDEVFVSGLSSGRQDKLNQSASAMNPPTNLRSYLLLLLQFHALMAYNNLASMDDELQLLANIPASAERDARERQAREVAEAERHRRRAAGEVDDNDDFRIERRFDASAPGPLMDDKGKPLRPFTITSRGNGNGSSRGNNAMQNLPIHELDERQRIRNSVFQPSHRLPTMSIDEYLQEEERRGNILRGGGAEGAAQATPREARSLRSENDGTREAYEAEEEARREAIEWDTFKESNKRGAGNTMNRG
ncbi:unnamed protein product [Sympodiomycopsis kandeliae]